jgi:hypothetical protein
LRFTARACGAVRGKTLTSQTEKVERPRDRIFDYVLDRLASLAVRASMECREPTCGARDPETNEVISCLSKDCGEKLMLAGWRRELQVMRDIRALVEGLERAEMQRNAADDKKGKRS